jgi:SAM-dependent methyltransferase
VDSPIDELHALVEEGDGRDRAFVDAIVRMRWSRDPARRADLSRLHDAVRAAALRAHEALRIRIAAGSLRGAELRRRFDDVPVLERDHFVEEVLGIAYPPLDEPPLARDLVAYAPSGYDEIVHALDATGLRACDRFFDVGAGAGKAVILAALLRGAESSGVECNASLVDLAERACEALRVPARFVRGDARKVAIDDAEVFFMYMPFTGGALATVMARLTRKRGRFLCAAPLDLVRWRELVVRGPSRSWLNVYAWR